MNIFLMCLILSKNYVYGTASGAVTLAHELPNTPSKSLQHASERMFPNINCLLRVICTLPVTTCECERSISVTRRLKTCLRATMGEERLSGLALMHIHYDMDLNVEEIIDIFARQHPRRMLLNLRDEL